MSSEKEIVFIVPTIRPFGFWKDYLNNFEKFGHSVQSASVLMIDEGDELVRKKNRELFPATGFEFFGPKEREGFFKEHFGDQWQKFATVIPIRNHAETSFGMLAGAARKAKLFFMIDDDTRATEEFDFIGDHSKIIDSDVTEVLASDSKWYKTIDSLEVNDEKKIYPRGFPFNRRFVDEKYFKKNVGKGKIVLNEGLWLNVPDMDAVGILEEGGLEGLPKSRTVALKEKSIVLDKGTFTTICSMNVSFSPKIIPAFYQLPMGYMGIGRFDDIWSGIFVKKVCDAMGHFVSVGTPCVIHDKERRDTMKDLKLELEGIMINEKLWRIVDEAEIDSSDYIAAYRSLIECIRNKLDVFDQRFKEYLDYVTKQMYVWTEICEKLE
ncbi:MAG TPA: hypothetical protein VJJ76_00930 [archaeon]|nr:hypothetical protein [archaeon]